MSNRSSSLPQRFLRAICNRTTTLEELKSHLAMDDDALGRWLGRPTFRKALRRSLRIAERRRELEIRLGSCAAAKRLVDFSQRQVVDHVARLSCLNLTQLGRLGRSVYAKPKIKRGKQAPPAPVSLIHPDVPQEEAEELMRQMETDTESVE